MKSRVRRRAALCTVEVRRNSNTGGRASLFAALAILAACQASGRGVGCGPGAAIPDGRGADRVPAFIGEPAVANPLPPKKVPPHPFLAEVNGGHIDSYNSGVQDVRGPLGVNPEVVSRSIDLVFGTCGLHVHDSRGRLISGCARMSGRSVYRLHLFDPRDLRVLDVHPLPNTFFDIFVGGWRRGQRIFIAGIYYHLDKKGRVAVGTIRNRLETIGIVDVDGAPRWKLLDSVDLALHLPETHALMDTIPDWQGNLWFVTSEALVGYVDADTGEVFTAQLPGEQIDNGIAVAEDGVYVVSDYATYRFEADARTGAPRFTWREEYQRATAPKAGSFAVSSGTAPTLLGDDLITITDNADSQINLLVYRRQRDIVGGRLVCRVPLFEAGASATDVSMIGYNDSIVIENNYNAPGFFGDYRELAPGLTRVDVLQDRSGCEVAWTNPVRSTTIPKLSTATGLIYTFTQRIEIEDPIDAWYFAAIDFRTGKTVFQVNLGTGLFKHNAFGGMMLGPDGTAYQGVLNGIMAIRDVETEAPDGRAPR